MMPAPFLDSLDSQSQCSKMSLWYEKAPWTTRAAMDLAEKQNSNPIVYAVVKKVQTLVVDEIEDEDSVEPWTVEEVFDLVRNLNDPEHPLTLEQLKVATMEGIQVEDDSNKVTVNFTPTIPHCSMATLIGLCIRVKLIRSLPRRFKVDIYITPGTHQSETAINKQLNDKERVAAALENSHLLGVVNKCIANTDQDE